MDKLSPKLATKLATIDVSEGLETSPSVSDSEDHETKKAPIIQGFDDICRLMSSLGISIEVDDIGLEPTTPTMSSNFWNHCLFNDFLNEIHHNRSFRLSQYFLVSPMVLRWFYR